jgi:hypothetical protein
MTEQEWLACNDPKKMLGWVGKDSSDRKLRLFACAAARTVWELLWAIPHSHRAIEIAEAYCDHELAAAALADAQRNVKAHLELHGNELVYEPSYWACSATISEDVFSSSAYAANVSMRRPFAFGLEEEAFRLRSRNLILQATLLRDIIGLARFREIAFEPEWRTETALGLARGIYDDRAFDRLPILADALQDAGCEDADILEHCRDDGPHVRGCWVVDLLLGKE